MIREALMVIYCPACGVECGYPLGIHLAKAKGGTAYCPNGHGHVYARPGTAGWTAGWMPGITSRLEYFRCTECAIQFGVSTDTADIRAKDGGTVWCPGGHKLTLPGSPAAESPRVGDTERDKVILRLQDAFTGGYLTPAEWEDLSTRALAARRQADLAAITAGLPAPVKKNTPAKPARKTGKRGFRSVFWAAVAGTNGLIAVAAMVTDDPKMLAFAIPQLLVALFMLVALRRG